MNPQVFARLTKPYSTSHQVIEKMSMTDMLDYLIDNNPDAYLMNTRTMGKLYDEEELALFEEAKEDPQLDKLFQEVKADIAGDHDGLVEKFKKEILDSLQVIKQEVSTKHFSQKNQIIFLEHDHRPFFTGVDLEKENIRYCKRLSIFRSTKKNFITVLAALIFRNTGPRSLR